METSSCAVDASDLPEQRLLPTEAASLTALEVEVNRPACA